MFIKKYKGLSLLIFSLAINSLFAQNFSDVNNYGTFSVKDGAKIYLKSFYNNGSGSPQFAGTSGEMHLTGDWQNNGSSTITLGTTSGTVFFEGTSLQTINYSTNLTQFAHLTVSTGSSVQVPAGKFISIKGNYTNSGVFTLKSNSAGTASLLDGNVFGSVTNTGNIKVERQITEGATPYYHYLSSPVGSAAYESIYDYSLGNYWIFWYDETVVNVDLDQGWKRFIKADEPYIRGRGYTGIYSASTTRVFEGPLQTNSDITTPVTWTETTGTWPNGDPRGWVLLGNPYPSPISASDFLSVNSDSTTDHPLTGTIYFWDDENGTIDRGNDYASWNKTGGIGNTAAGHSNYAPNDTIAIGQGFFAQYDKTIGTGNSRNATVYFKNSMRSHNIGSQYFIPDAFEYPKLLLGVTGKNNNYNEILIGFMDNKTWSFNRMYDGIKLKGNPHIALYTDLIDGQYGITALPLPEKTFIIPLGLDANDGGLYVFKTEMIENFNGMHVYLEDRKLNIFTDLSEGKSYNINLPAGIYQNRFFIRFEVSTTIAEEKVEELIINVKGNNLVINSANPFQPKTTVIVSDMLGKQIYKGIFEGNTTTIRLGNDKGYYFVSLMSGNISQSQKVFIP